MTSLNLQDIQLSVALKGRIGPILSGFFCVFSKLSTCLQYIGDSHHQESKEVSNVTLRDGLNSPTVKRLAEPSAMGGLPMDYLGPIACDSLATQLSTASTGAWDILQ